MNIDPNKTYDVALTGGDIMNLHAILQRATFNGLQEAAVGVHLAGKLQNAPAAQAQRDAAKGALTPTE